MYHLITSDELKLKILKDMVINYGSSFAVDLFMYSFIYVCVYV